MKEILIILLIVVICNLIYILGYHNGAMKALNEIDKLIDEFIDEQRNKE